MGIIADIVHDNQERNYDVYGIAGGQEYLRIHAQEFENAYRKYRETRQCHNQLTSEVFLSDREKVLALVHQQLELFKKQLIAEAVILVQIQLRCVIRERIITQLQHSVSPSSTIIADSMEAVANCIFESRNIVVTLLDKLDEEIYQIALQKTGQYTDENTEYHTIADSLLIHAYQYLSNSAHVLDRFSFRLLETDCVAILRNAYGEAYGTKKYEIISTYLKERFNVKEQDVLCPHCGNPMFTNIPNCLNCYERR